MTEYVHVPLKPVRVVRVTYTRSGKLKPRIITDVNPILGCV